MRTAACLLGLLLLMAAPAAAQPFTSSHLPLFIIDTEGQEIPNEPKIRARMRVVDNGPGQVNRLTDPANAYDGFIGIETRGSSTQMFPKKQFAVETWEADSSNNNVSLLGFPRESDWILYAPYTDKSLVRNVLVYGLARRMGRYATRTRWVELVLNGRYDGVYVLMEKIKQDRGRVDIAGLDEEDTEGDALTGGYLLKVDKWEGSDNEGWASKHRPAARPDREILYQYHDPKGSKLAPAQKAYIRGVIDAFEAVMAGPGFADAQTGYPALLDVGSFVDFFVLNELTRNVDGYRLSAFLYKDRDSRDGRLVAGPVWDFNLGFGNADYYNGSAITGWQVHFGVATDDFHVPFWWNRLLEDAAFRAAVAARWRSLRQGPLHTDSLTAAIDAHVEALGPAVDRNFARWPVLAQYVWPNNYVGGTYVREVDYLKGWIRDRAAWIDANVDLLRPLGTEGGPSEVPVDAFRVSAVYPNPVAGTATVTLTVGLVQPVRVEVCDALGRRVALLHDGSVASDVPRPFTFSTAGWPDGTYFVRATGRDRHLTQPFVVTH